MFYSHTFLGRKGPLGTIWQAAHLQHKIKKSQITATDIAKSVERIMFPDAPIALRLSGHLLLGVVRIYSKKVEYLHHDCRVVRVVVDTACSTSMVNLPQDADKAPVHAVTLPETFDLDAWDFEDEFDISRFQDNHLRSQEEITLAGHIPAEYVGITMGEEILQNKSHHENRLEPEPMEEDTEIIIPVAKTPYFQDPGPSNQTEDNEISFEELPPEFRLDGAREFSPVNMDEQLERDRVLEEHIKSDKKMLTPNAASGEKSAPESQSLLQDHHQEPPPTAFDHGHDISEDAQYLSPQHHQESPHGVFEEGNDLSDYRLVDSAVQVEQQQLVNRRRKRPLLFDDETVLNNQFLKTALKETGDIRRKRKNCPHSAFRIWKLNKRLKKDKVFFDHIFTGLSDDLNMLTEDIISLKPHLISTESTQSDPNAPSTSDPDNEFHGEMEHLRDHGQTSPHSTLMPCNNSARTDDFTPAPTTANFGSEQATTASRTEDPMTSDVDAHTGSFVSDMETPAPVSEERYGFDNTGGLSDIPEMDDSANGELSFLEDDQTPSGSQGTPEADFLLKENATPEISALSVRTRAVAQFLVKKLSDTPSTDDESAELSLIKTLEGKTRKVSARMFYETLVLKSCGLLDLDQQEPYGDITMKLTSRLSKEQFSA